METTAAIDEALVDAGLAGVAVAETSLARACWALAGIDDSASLLANEAEDATALDASDDSTGVEDPVATDEAASDEG